MSALDEAAVLSMLDRAVAGDARALDALCRLAEPWITPVVLRFRFRESDADDVVQEVFAHLLTVLPKFDRRSKFSTWVHRVTFNRVLMYIRGSRTRLRRQLDEDRAPDSAFIAPQHEVPERLLADKRRVQAVREAFDELRFSHELRDQIDRYYGDDECLASIAESHGITEKALRKRMFNARRKLEAHLGDEEAPASQ